MENPDRRNYLFYLVFTSLLSCFCIFCRISSNLDIWVQSLRPQIETSLRWNILSSFSLFLQFCGSQTIVSVYILLLVTFNDWSQFWRLSKNQTNQIGATKLLYQPVYPGSLMQQQAPKVLCSQQVFPLLGEYHELF